MVRPRRSAYTRVKAPICRVFAVRCARTARRRRESRLRPVGTAQWLTGTAVGAGVCYPTNDVAMRPHRAGAVGARLLDFAAKVIVLPAGGQCVGAGERTHGAKARVEGLALALTQRIADVSETRLLVRRRDSVMTTSGLSPVYSVVLLRLVNGARPGTVPGQLATVAVRRLPYASKP